MRSGRSSVRRRSCRHRPVAHRRSGCSGPARTWRNRHRHDTRPRANRNHRRNRQRDSKRPLRGSGRGQQDALRLSSSRRSRHQKQCHRAHAHHWFGYVAIPRWELCSLIDARGKSRRVAAAVCSGGRDALAASDPIPRAASETTRRLEKHSPAKQTSKKSSSAYQYGGREAMSP